MRFRMTIAIAVGLMLTSIIVLPSLLMPTWLQAGPEAVVPLSPLGPPPIPADNPQTVAKVELGKVLFFDPRIGGDASTACSTCHNPTLGWGDGSDICRGYPGTSHWRNCQTIVNSAYYSKLFWAGSSTSLEAQAPSAAKGAVAGNGEDDMIEERLRQIPEYVQRFKEVFGAPPLIANVWEAIASFERTIVQRGTPLDRYLEGENTALSVDALNGLKLFEGKAKCIRCHQGALMTDEGYHNLGVPENEVFDDEPLAQITFRYEQFAKGVSEELYRKTKTDLGLYYKTKMPEAMGRFRTPSLRYINYTGPYMHNGVFWSLEEVIDFYNAGGGEDPIHKAFGIQTKDTNLQPLGLSDAEKGQLLQFLIELSGDEILIDPPTLPPYEVLEAEEGTR